MATKQIELPGIGLVKLYKKRGSRSLRISVSVDGSIRVSLPAWASYSSGIEFAKSQREWIGGQLAKRRRTPLLHGQAVGKAHHLFFNASGSHKSVAAKISHGQILVNHPAHQSPEDAAVQLATLKYCERALKKEADQLLPLRLSELATKHSFNYRSVSTRRLKSRWGSCNSAGDITLNIYLMQLPWTIIDYVILHELTHTRLLKHGPEFWSELERLLPKAKALRKLIRTYEPDLRVNASAQA